MPRHEDILKKVIGHSKAMYSTWFYYNPARVLFDAGEGLFSGMGNSVFGIDTVFLSHCHHDHVGGLAGLIYARSCARGDKAKPLTVYYPDGWHHIAVLQRYVESAGGRSYPLTWKIAEDGVEVTGDKFPSDEVVRPFRVRHSRQGVCLGYALVEKRKGLKPDIDIASLFTKKAAYQRVDDWVESNGLREVIDAKGTRVRRRFYKDKAFELTRKFKSEMGEVHEAKENILLAYCGDSAPVDPDKVRGAEVLMHESTFVNEGDRRSNSHSTVREALEVAQAAEVKSLVLFHVSGRYPAPVVEQSTRNIAREVRFEQPLSIFLGSRMVTIVR